MSRRYKGTSGLPEWWPWAVVVVLALAVIITLIRAIFGL